MLLDSYWNKLIFSDESKFNLILSDGINPVWREPGSKLNSKYISHTIKHDGGNVMIWGCISSIGVENLVFIEDTMDRFKYVNILAKNLK